MNNTHIPGIDLSCSILGRANGNLANAILDKINAFIFIIDIPNLRIIWTNRFMIHKMGFSFEELQNMTSDEVLSLIHPDFHKSFTDSLNSVKETSTPKNYLLFRIMTKENCWLWTLMNLNIFEIPPIYEKKYAIAFGSIMETDQIKFICDQIKADPQHKNIFQMPLSKREISVVKLVSLGMTDREIAEKLFISIHTAKTHRKKIIHKLGFSNTATLINYTIGNGLV